MDTKQNKEKPPKGFTCTSCGVFQTFSLYVFAHWRDNLTHTCECGAKHDIVCGLAFKGKAGKKKGDQWTRNRSGN